MGRLKDIKYSRFRRLLRRGDAKTNCMGVCVGSPEEHYSELPPQDRPKCYEISGIMCFFRSSHGHAVTCPMSHFVKSPNSQHHTACSLRRCSGVWGPSNLTRPHGARNFQAGMFAWAPRRQSQIYDVANEPRRGGSPSDEPGSLRFHNLRVCKAFNECPEMVALPRGIRKAHQTPSTRGAFPSNLRLRHSSQFS